MASSGHSKKRVCYYYDGKLLLWNSIEVKPKPKNVKSRGLRSRVNWLNWGISLCVFGGNVIVHWPSLIYEWFSIKKLYFFRWCWKLLLWTRSSNETTQNTHDPQSDSKLWVVPKNGNIRSLGLSIQLGKKMVNWHPHRLHNVSI